jgi:hypothetical protein
MLVEFEFFYRNLKNVEEEFIKVLIKNDNIFNDDS